jgi:hypothetical protein
MEQGMSEGFGHIKKKLVTTSILMFPYWNKEFHVHVDGSSITLGTILYQLAEGDIDHLIYFASRKCNILNHPQVRHAISKTHF